MEHFKILRLNEDDITKIIIAVGGQKLDTRGKEKKRTADYLLNEAIIELKLIEEEGLDKEERQEKLTTLFKDNQKNRPTVIIDKRLLTKEETKKFYRILETPIKSSLKSASKQLKSTQKDLYPQKLRVCIILNVGYSSLHIDEFEELAKRKAKNDTSGIDFLIVGGIYFFGDGFEYYSIAPFKLIKLQSKRKFESYEILGEQWGVLLKEIMTDSILGKNKERYDKTVNYDLCYTKQGIHFVKPTPQMGKKSDFYLNGRPRSNTTGIEVCPPVAHTFPLLDLKNWRVAKDNIYDEFELTESHSEYIDLMNSNKDSLRQPLVPIPIDYVEFQKHCFEYDEQECFQHLCYYANDLFSKKLKCVCNQKRELIQNESIVPSRYIFLYVEEIGRDCKYDISKLSIITEGILGSNEQIIFEDENIFFLWSVALAGAYAIKNHVDFLYYQINRDYGWY